MDHITAQGSAFSSLLARTSVWARKTGVAGLAVGAAIALGACSPAVEEPTSAGSVEAQAVATSTPTAQTQTATAEPTPAPEPTATTPTPSQAPTSEKPREEPASAGTALAQLATIEIKGRAPKTGYDRDNFGSGWTDIDHNGCDSLFICTFPTSTMSTSW